MGRRKIIPDTAVYDVVRHLLMEEGEKAATFGAVARATGLAGATLVQRFGSQQGMLRGALAEAWDRLDAALDPAEAEGKGPVAILKVLAAAQPAIPALYLACRRDAALRARAAGWRAALERRLAPRLGGGRKGARAAAILVAAWMGQMLAGGDGFRLKDAARRPD